jgi:hypothetical protein
MFSYHEYYKAISKNSLKRFKRKFVSKISGWRLSWFLEELKI